MLYILAHFFVFYLINSLLIFALFLEIKLASSFSLWYYSSDKFGFQIFTVLMEQMVKHFFFSTP